MDKLDLHSATALTAYAIREGLMDGDTIDVKKMGHFDFEVFLIAPLKLYAASSMH